MASVTPSSSVDMAGDTSNSQGGALLRDVLRMLCILKRSLERCSRGMYRRSGQLACGDAQDVVEMTNGSGKWHWKMGSLAGYTSWEPSRM